MIFHHEQVRVVASQTRQRTHADVRRVAALQARACLLQVLTHVGERLQQTHDQINQTAHVDAVFEEVEEEGEAVDHRQVRGRASDVRLDQLQHLRCEVKNKHELDARHVTYEVVLHCDAAHSNTGW